MSTSKSSFAIPILTFLILLVGMGLFSCSPDTSPSNSAELERGGVTGIPADQFKPLSFRDLSPDPSAAKLPSRLKDGDDQEYEESAPCIVTELISAEQGGQLLLDWEIKDEDGVTGSKVKAEIKIFPGALDEDTEIAIGLLNPAYAMVFVDLEFGEHGTQFQIPAELTLDLEGLDLPAYSNDDLLNLYWYDPLSDAWFPVPRDEDKFEVKLEKGTIQGIWYLSHFSRYSLSGGR